jgi:predicted molibdopterin-dependent oxidoreductase YjgC
MRRIEKLNSAPACGQLTEKLWAKNCEFFKHNPQKRASKGDCITVMSSNGLMKRRMLSENGRMTRIEMTTEMEPTTKMETTIDVLPNISEASPISAVASLSSPVEASYIIWWKVTGLNEVFS